MYFSHKKLPPEAAQNLRNCPINTVAPFSLMIAPVYVFMRRNKKFVAIKAPLDFFTPMELKRLGALESFFLPEFVDAAVFYRDTARQLRALIQWKPGEKKAGTDLVLRELKLPPAPFEISDAVLRLLAPLWGFRQAIEPFFLAVFANEICEGFSEETLKKCRDKGVDLFELALFRSGWAVFLALHLGFCNWNYLNWLRNKVFFSTLSGTVDCEASPEEEVELLQFVWSTLCDLKVQLLGRQLFESTSGRLCEKLMSRLNRIQKDCSVFNRNFSPTIYGSGGFIDV